MPGSMGFDCESCYAALRLPRVESEGGEIDGIAEVGGGCVEGHVDGMP